MKASAATLSKDERLHGTKEIETLLKAGRWGAVGCIRYCLKDNGLDYARILVSVPKRLFKRAVKRNLLKRRIREAYRLRKPAVGKDIFFQYTSPEVLPFAEIDAAVAEIISRAEK